MIRARVFSTRRGRWTLKIQIANHDEALPGGASPAPTTGNATCGAPGIGRGSGDRQAPPAWPESTVPCPTGGEKAGRGKPRPYDMGHDVFLLCHAFL